jgi:hypothetical protein
MGGEATSAIRGLRAGLLSRIEGKQLTPYGQIDEEQLEYKLRIAFHRILANLAGVFLQQ